MRAEVEYEAREYPANHHLLKIWGLGDSPVMVYFLCRVTWVDGDELSCVPVAVFKNTAEAENFNVLFRNE